MKFLIGRSVLLELVFLILNGTLDLGMEILHFRHFQNWVSVGIGCWYWVCHILLQTRYYTKTISTKLHLYCIYIALLLQFIAFILQFCCNYLPVDHQQSSIPCSMLVGLPKCFVSKHLCQHRCKEPLWCSPIWFWKPFELSYFWYKPDKQM